MYYSQLAQGHLSLLYSARPIDEILLAENQDPELIASLQLTLRAREFAANELQLKFNNSYTDYVDLDRRYVVQNLFAAEEFSTQLHSWCYWIIGCANYRGFFDASLLEKTRANFTSKGYDVYVGQVSAYSTLGWFNDPLPSTFVDLPKYRIVGLIFHELAHQQIYVEGDTFFNESFAIAVEQAGIEQFYAAHESITQRQEYSRYRARSVVFTELAVSTREQLAVLYRQRLSRAVMRDRKAAILAESNSKYRTLTGAEIEGAVFNNASLGAVAAYHKYVDAFLNMLAAGQGDFALFYEQVKRISKLQTKQREQCLHTWQEVSAASSAKALVNCSI